MPPPRFSNEEIAQRGRDLYEERIRKEVEPDHVGKFLVLDVETGDHELHPSTIDAYQAIAARRPGGAFYILRVGHRAAFRIGPRRVSRRLPEDALPSS